VVLIRKHCEKQGSVVITVIDVHTDALAMLLSPEFCVCVWLNICNCRLPHGVINVLPGDAEVGRLLVTHSQVSKVMFSGSTGVGLQMRKQTAGLGIHLTMCK
jgi:hypothetical protein